MSEALSTLVLWRTPLQPPPRSVRSTARITPSRLSRPSLRRTIFEVKRTHHTGHTLWQFLTLKQPALILTSAGLLPPMLGLSGQVLAACDWIIDPGIEIPTSATLIHGISTERAQREGDEPAQAVAQILTALQYLHQRGVAIVAYNAAYDFTILQHEAIRYGLTPFPESGPIIDPFVIDKAVDRYRPGKRTLSATAEHYG